MSAKDSSNTHEVIGEIFRAMNTEKEKRDAANLPRWTKDFPYVNGGLFSDSTETPKFSKIARSYLLHVGHLDWTKINPDIFGSMIQAVADDEERGSLGMHYTSVPNILKVECVKNVPLSQVTNEQQHFLDQTQITPYIGEAGEDFITKILHDNVLDTATAAKKFRDASGHLNTAISRFDQIKKALTGLVQEHVVATDGAALIRVTFTKEASIHNIVDLNAWSKEWEHIIRGFTLINGKSPEDVKLVSVSNGSLIATLLADLSVVKDVLGTMLLVFAVAEKINKYRNDAKQYRSEGHEDAAKAIEKTAATAEKNGVSNIVRMIQAGGDVTINNITVTGAGHTGMDGEQVTALTKSIERLLDFTKKGGEVDIIAPDAQQEASQPDKAGEIKQLREGTEELRRIENKQKLLNYDKPAKAKPDDDGQAKTT